MENNSSSANRQIARAASTVMLAFILSSAVGLIRQVLVANAFGTRMEMEAFNAANRVSETLFTLVAGGALASAFIPVFSGLLATKKNEEAWKLASSIINLVLVILSLSAVIAFVFAPWIVNHVIAPGFSSDPEKVTLTINLLRMMLPSAIIFGISGLVMGMLNSYHIFFIPTITPAMYQIGLIFGVLVLSPYIGIYGLAIGVLIGASLHLGLQLPSLFHLHGQYFPMFGTELASVREVIRLMLPRLLGVGIVQINFWVNIRLASGMPEGSVTGIVIAFTLMLMPQAAIAQSIAIASMPTFSAQVALGKIDEMRNSLASTIRSVLLLSFPAAVGLILLRKPIVTMLYQRGEFTAYSTILVSWALLWYGIGLVSHSVVEILARAFYSLHDTLTPVLVGALAMSLNIGFSYLFAAWFAKMGWLPHGGLAFANSVATTLEMAGLLYFMRKKLKRLEGLNIIRTFLKVIVATLIMSISIWIWITKMASQPAWLVATGGIVIGGIVYGLLLLLLKVEEVKSLLKIIQQKI